MDNTLSARLIKYISLFFSLSMFCFIMSTAIMVGRRPYDGMTKSALGILQSHESSSPNLDAEIWVRTVMRIDPSGPAALAGVQVGDVIVAQDDTPIVHVSDLYADKVPGDQVSFEILGGASTESVVLDLVKPGTRMVLQRMVILLIAFAFWIVGPLMLSLQPTSREGLLLFLYTQVGAGALAMGTLSAFNLRWVIALFNPVLALLSALLVHFHLLFPKRELIRRYMYVVYGAYTLAVILSLPSISLMLSSQGMPPWYPTWRGCVRAYLALATLSSIGLLIHAYTAAHELQVRRQVRVIALGTASAFAPLALLVIIPEMLTSGSALISYEIGFLPLTLIPVAYAFAVYRHNLLDIDRFLNRGVVHFLLGVLWIVAFLIADLALSAASFSQPATFLLRSLAALLLAWGLVALQPRLQHWVDRAFYGSWYDYRSVVTRASQALYEARDETTLIEYLVHRVRSAMDLRSAALFLDTMTGNFVLRACEGFVDLSLDISLPDKGLLMSSLRRRTSPLMASTLRDMVTGESLSTEEQAWLARDTIRLWVPLVFKDKMQGLLLLGEKATGEPFDAEDLRIMETLGRQAALVAENVQLVSSLQDQVQELSQLRGELETTHHRLLLSREEERKQLARELHDRLLQAYISLNMDVDALVDLVDNSQQMAHVMAVENKVRELIVETRHLCTELRPPSLGIAGLASTIRSYTEQWAEQNGNIRVIGGFSNSTPQAADSDQMITLDLAQDRKRLPEEIEITLFRVYQEALTNIARHAGARNVWVVERLEDDRIELSIRDNGCGFVLPERFSDLARQEHFGLLGIQERMMAVDGHVQVTSQPGQGTQIRVWVSLNKGQ